MLLENKPTIPTPFLIYLRIPCRLIAFLCTHEKNKALRLVFYRLFQK